MADIKQTIDSIPDKKPKKLTIGEGAIVCTDAELYGDITIGKGTVIHPKVVIIAHDGPIIIGENNIIEERTVILHYNENFTKTETSTTKVETENENETQKEKQTEKKIETEKETNELHIGSYNHFEVGTIIHGKKVGSFNIFEPKSVVGRNICIKDECIIGSGVRLSSQYDGTSINSTIYWGESNSSRSNSTFDQSSYIKQQHQHLEFLGKTLPNFHRLQK